MCIRSTAIPESEEPKPKDRARFGLYNLNAGDAKPKAPRGLDML